MTQFHILFSEYIYMPSRKTYIVHEHVLNTMMVIQSKFTPRYPHLPTVVHTYRDGIASLHSCVSNKYLLPLKYLATERRPASGQSDQSAAANAAGAEGTGLESGSRGLPSPCVAKRGIKQAIC